MHWADCSFSARKLKNKFSEDVIVLLLSWGQFSEDHDRMCDQSFGSNRGSGIWKWVLCGRMKWNHLSFGRFPLFCRHFCVQFEANLTCVIRPIVAMSGLPLFCRHVGCFWVPEPTFTFFPFRPPGWPFLHSKNTTF